MGSNIFIESLYDIYWMKNIAEFSKLDLIIAILNGYIIYLLLMNDSLDNRLIDNVNFKLCGIRDGLLRHQFDSQRPPRRNDEKILRSRPTIKALKIENVWSDIIFSQCFLGGD